MIINYDRLLDLFIEEIIPPSYENVKLGNIVFRATILENNNLSTIYIGFNNEIINPLYHGEISIINNYFIKDNKIDPNKCLFISSHEPCS